MISSNPPDTTTWFSALSAVASRVVISLIHVKLEYMDEKGKKTSLSKQSCKDIMMRVPTSWTVSEQPIAHLPIGSSPLHEWVSFFEGEQDLDQPIRLPDSITHEFKEIKSEKFVEIPQQVIDLELKNASTFNDELNRSFVSACTDSGIDINTFSSTDFLSAAAYPPAREYGPTLSRFDTAFLNSNIFGQAALMYKRLDEERLRMELLAQNCIARHGVLDACIEQLRTKWDALTKAQQRLDEDYTGLNAKEEEQSSIQDRLATAEQNPTWAAFFRRSMDIQTINTQPRRLGSQPPLPPRRQVSESPLLPSATFSLHILLPDYVGFHP